MKLKSKNLKQEVTKNTSVTRKTVEGVETLQSGSSLDHENKHNAHGCACSSKSNEVVGISMGVTKNMSNYESLRVDCWLTDEVKKGETKEEALQRLTEIAEGHLEEVVCTYTEE